jgi:hypothetical protein
LIFIGFVEKSASLIDGGLDLGSLPLAVYSVFVV